VLQVSTPPPLNRDVLICSGAIYTTLGEPSGPFLFPELIVVAFYGALFPTSTILLFFIIPMPVWAAIGGFFSVSL
jgi:hypothetical protein